VLTTTTGGCRSGAVAAGWVRRLTAAVRLAGLRTARLAAAGASTVTGGKVFSSLFCA
jgi:hypothetical protein